jgi:polyhydroxyalkanoate synthase
MPAVVSPGELVDRARRDAERNVLRVRNGLRHLAGVGRPQLTPTSKETVWSAEKVELWHYPSDRVRFRTPLLFVHSLVTRSYVFDLVPGNSVVEVMLDRGFDVYLIDWGIPDELESLNTLETYADGYVPTIVAEIQRRSGARDVNLFGYCFGGVLSLLSVAGNPWMPIRSLAVMATPIDMARMGPMSSLLQDGRIEPEDLLDHTGNVPPDVMLTAFKMLQPLGDVTGFINLWEHLWNDDFVAAHQVLTQWSQDHIPFPGEAFCQLVDLLARRNLLATGRVPIGGRTVDLSDITVPFLNILGEKGHIVPPDAVGPLPSLVGSRDVEELRLPAGHAGVIVGRAAQRHNIPAMADWIARHAEPR